MSRMSSCFPAIDPSPPRRLLACRHSNARGRMCCIYTRTFSIQSAHARHPSIHGTIPSIPTDPCHAPCPDQSFSRGPWSASPAFSNAHPLTPRKRPFPERRLLHAHPPLRYEMPTPPAPRRWCPRLPRLSPTRSPGSPDLPPCCRAFAVSQSHRPHHLAAHLAACLTKSLRSPTPTTNPRVCVCVCVCVCVSARARACVVLGMCAGVPVVKAVGNVLCTYVLTSRIL